MDKQMGPPIGLPEIGEPFGPWFYFEILGDHHQSI
jgi:hypothetical protein